MAAEAGRVIFLWGYCCRYVVCAPVYGPNMGCTRWTLALLITTKQEEPDTVEHIFNLSCQQAEVAGLL